MPHILVIFRLVIFTVKVLVNFGMKLNEGRNQACSQGTKVTAVLSSVEDENLKYLFSGDLVFTLKVSDLELVEVEKIEEKYPNISGPIESAWFNWNLEEYVFGKKDEVLTFNIGTQHVEHSTWMEYHMKRTSIYGFKHLNSLFICASLYKDNPMKLAFVDPRGKAFICKVEKVAQQVPDSKSRCRSIEQPIPNPSEIPAQQLEGVTFEGLSIDGVEGEDYKLRLVLADKVNIRLWHDNELIKKVTLSELFNCSSNIVLKIILVVVILVVLVVLLAGSVSLILVKRSDKVAPEMTTSADISKNIPKSVST